MRWRLRRRAVAERGPAAGRVLAMRRSARARATMPSAGAAVAHWRRVPPLVLTIAPRPVLVSGSLLGLPPVSGTRSVVRGWPGARLGLDGYAPEQARGRVTGIVAPRMPAEYERLGPAAPGTGLPRPAPRRRPPAHAAATSQRPILVEATAEFVGDPRPDDTPYTSSAWLRMIQAYRPQLPDIDDGAGASGPGFLVSSSDDGSTVTSWSSEAVFAPPRQPSPDVGAAAAVTAAERPRRASLAESRRLGIGRPLPRGSRADAEERPELADADQGVPAAPGSEQSEADAEGSPTAITTEPLPAMVEATGSRPPVPAGFGLGPPVKLRGVPTGNRRRDDAPAPARWRRPADTPAPPARYGAEARPAKLEEPDTQDPLDARDWHDTDGGPDTDDEPDKPSTPDWQDGYGGGVTSHPAPPTLPAILAPVHRAAGQAAATPTRHTAASLAGEHATSELIHRSPAPPPALASSWPSDPPGVPIPVTSAPPEPPVPPYRDIVPHDLADAIRRAHGVDVADVLVNRAPEAGQQARAIGARAFTSDGEIVLPPDAGPIERPQTRALLAHELTHAAQQRALGPSLPPEDSAYGAALEAAAVATERRVLGLPQEQPAISMRQQPLVHGVSTAGAASWSAPPAGAATPAPVQRQTEEIPDAATTGNAFDPLALLPRQGVAPVPDLSQAAVPSGVAVLTADQTGGELESARVRLLKLAEQRLLDLDDSLAVADLADGIYGRIRAKLRRELLVDRERSGLLSDFR